MTTAKQHVRVKGQCAVIEEPLSHPRLILATAHHPAVPLFNRPMARNKAPASTGGDSTAQSPVEMDDDAEFTPLSIPDVPGDPGEGGKLKMIVQLVKRCLGVKDIAAMRLSLPASLLEPIPNLEYWQYLDRPDIFASINHSEDSFERMLAVLRFVFTKDLKFIVRVHVSS